MESQLEIINRLIEEGKSYTFANFCYERPEPQHRGIFGGEDTPEWSTYKIRVKNIVSTLVSDSSPAMELVRDGISIHTQGNGPDKFDAAKYTLIKALELVASTLENDVYGELKRTTSEATSPLLSNKVFVVHGHDQGLKTDIERFLHEIGLEPIVLHRQPDQGQTLIEKFETHSDVGYAFILLTPDEVAYTIDQEAKSDEERTKEKRARPNVIFEFGYFVGRLGRKKVCCLYKEGVVLPSDLDGLIYKRVEDSVEPQAYAIIRELQAAGYKIKM